MSLDDTFGRWIGRLCVGTVGLLGLLGMYYGNIRFAPIAAGFAILAAVCYGYVGRPGRSPAVARAVTARPSLTSGHVPRLSPYPPYALGPRVVSHRRSVPGPAGPDHR